MARGLALIGLVCAAVGAGCAAPAPPVPLSHVDRVIEDVTAMVEGMAQAHAGPGGMALGPEFRSLTPRSESRP